MWSSLGFVDFVFVTVLDWMGPRRKRSFQFNGVREFLNQLLVDKPLLPFVIPFLLIVWCIEKWFFSLSNWVPLVVAVWVTIQVTPPFLMSLVSYNFVDSFLSFIVFDVHLWFNVNLWVAENSWSLGVIAFWISFSLFWLWRQENGLIALILLLMVLFLLVIILSLVSKSAFCFIYWYHFCQFGIANFISFFVYVLASGISLWSVEGIFSCL